MSDWQAENERDRAEAALAERTRERDELAERRENWRKSKIKCEEANHDLRAALAEAVELLRRWIGFDPPIETIDSEVPIQQFSVESESVLVGDTSAFLAARGGES